MGDDQRELSRLWRILRTTKQMCADRVRTASPSTPSRDHELCANIQFRATS